MIICIFAPSVPTKPLNDAQMRGAFLFIYVHYQNTLMERLPHFMKYYMTEADLMTLLKSRGLVISDEGKVNILQLIQHVLQWFSSSFLYKSMMARKCLWLHIVDTCLGN